jgi:hypothetical protein
LERLPPGCSRRTLREAEQRHIDRLRSWAPDLGFNIVPAVYEGDGPSQRTGRQFKAAVMAAVRGAKAKYPNQRKNAEPA